MGTSNGIPERQNDIKNLELQAAKTILYRDGKIISALRFTILLFSAVAGPLIGGFYTGHEALAIFIALLAFLVDAIFLEDLSRRMKETGARIQELFDGDVLQIRWGVSALGDPELGDQPELGDVKTKAEAYQSTDPNYEKLKNWYDPAVGELPLHLARLICQRINVHWDTTLRQRLMLFLKAFLIMIVIVILIISFYADWTLAKTAIVLVAPAMPLAGRILQILTQHQENKKHSEFHRKFADLMWKRALAGEVNENRLEEESRILQNMIFLRRQNSPWISELLYSILRSRLAIETHMLVSNFIRDYNQHVSS